MPEAEVELKVEEEEDLKQEENVLKEEEDQMYQINLKRGRGPIVTQERKIINMVLANNAIRLREIQANIIGDHAISNNVHQASQSTLGHILKRHQVKMNQLYLYCIFSFFTFFNGIVTCTGYIILRLSDIC